MARSLLSSLEADRYVVRDLFDRTLRRRPGRPEVRFWAQAMASGVPEVGVLGALTGSLEFFDRFPRSEG